MSKTCSPDDLKQFATKIYLALGLTPSDAELVADSLVQAELWGHPSHGVMRTIWYARRIRSGAIRIDRQPSVEIDGGAVAVIDGQDSIGQVIAQSAMNEAVERARAHGVGAVAVRNSGHFGTAMYYTRKAAMRGCIGFLSTNASAAMAPWGGRDKLIGTNPWSIAAPAGRYAPMLLDMANTAVARGKLHVAQKRGESIPAGWATAPDGTPTTDPAQGILGNILPMAGHKGYAIATMMDVLSGLLSGGSFADAVTGPYVEHQTSGAGHLALALNVAAFRPLDDFCRDMERLIEKIKSVPKAEGASEIFYPGEPEARHEQRLTQSGIAIAPETLRELGDLAGSLGVSPLD